LTNRSSFRSPFFDSSQFVVGVNLPWIGYGTDIGASAWYPAGGLSAQPASRDLLDRTFDALGRDGVSVVRLFLLCDARSGVRFDDDGIPVGVDEHVFPDIDALLACAHRHSIGLMPVLLDFHLCKAGQIINGVQLGGRSQLIADPDARTAFVDRVLRPIGERYGDDDAIVAWDVMNEPEWCLGIGPLARRRGVGFEVLQTFLGEAVRCLHESTRHPVTVGCAATTWLDLVRPLGLDLYQVHWYERFGWDKLARPVADLGLDDRPVILGEFPGRRTAVAEVLDVAKRAGYAGALVWSVLGEDQASAYPPDIVTMARAARPRLPAPGLRN